MTLRSAIRSTPGCLIENSHASRDQKASPRPSHHDQVFHHFCFRFVGRRGAGGQFLNRDRFYSLSDEFYSADENRLAGYLEGLAEELLL